MKQSAFVLFIALIMNPYERCPESSPHSLTDLRLVVNLKVVKSGAGSKAIVGDVLVENFGGQVGWIDGRLMLKGHIRCTVYDVEGKMVQYPGWNTKIKIPKPSDRWVFVQVLSGRVYGANGLRLCQLTSPGTYKIRLEYSNAGMERYAEEWGIRLSDVVAFETVLRL